MRRYCLFQGPIEERLQQPLKGGQSRSRALPCGGIYKLAAALAVAEMAFLLQNAQEGADRSARRRVGEPLEDVGSSGLTAGVNNLHDLPLTAAEMGHVLHNS